MVVAQLADHLRLVAPRIDLLHAQHGRDVRNPPGMHVEHWRQWHVHVFNAPTGRSCGGTERTRHGERVKHKLAVGEGAAFRVLRKARSDEHTSELHSPMRIPYAV